MSLNQQNKVGNEPGYGTWHMNVPGLLGIPHSLHEYMNREGPSFLLCLASLAFSSRTEHIPEPKSYYYCRERTVPFHPQQPRSYCDFSCLKAGGNVPFYCRWERERNVTWFLPSLLYYCLPKPQFNRWASIFLQQKGSRPFSLSCCELFRKLA